MIECNSDRLLIVNNRSTSNLRFFTYNNDRRDKIKLKFIKDYNAYVARVIGDVLVFKTPLAAAFDREYNVLNRLSLRGIDSISIDELVYNMLEYIETI